MGAELMTIQESVSVTVNSTAAEGKISRRDFMLELVRQLPAETLAITGLGSPSYDVFAAGYRDENYHLWGAMGGAVPFGLGVSLAQPDRPVLVVTGDGEQLMGIGALATVAVKQPPNLTILVLDNGHFGETGMQRSHSSLGTDLAAAAKGLGIQRAERLTEQSETSVVLDAVRKGAGTAFFQALIQHDEPPRALPPRDGVANKNSFRAALGLETF